MNRNSDQGMQADMDVERVLTDEQARDLVVAVVSQHADSLLRTARRHSLCADDAQDAYQRTMEIFVRRAATLDPAQAHKWAHTVCKHEAMAVREQRQELVSHEEPDLDREEARNTPSPEDRAVSFDRLRRSAEALQRLKPHELRALWLRAEGFTYDEISRQTGWTYTKVNRCITEGRRAFMATYARIEGGAECERWLPLLSAIVDGEATSEQLMEIRPHLHNCAACRATVRELHATTAPLAALLPAGFAPAAAHGHGLIARAFEAMTGGIHDRVTSAALKIQAVAETASDTKLAAVAASAAAIAGGGAVVVDGATMAQKRHAPVARVRPAAQRAAPAVSAAANPAPVTRRAPQATPKHRIRKEFRARRAPSAATEFASATTATAPPPAPAPASPVVRSTSAEPAGSGREFASEFGG